MDIVPFLKIEENNNVLSIEQKHLNMTCMVKLIVFHSIRLVAC